MSSDLPTHIPGDKLKKAILEFSELTQKNPDKKRSAIINEMAIKFDLTPQESAFLQKHFSNDGN